MKPKRKNNSEKFKGLKFKDIISYDDIHDLVEYLVKTNAYKYTFDGFDVEDIGQEIRKKAFLLLEKWNNKRAKGNPIWFFGVSVQNHLKNLRRDNNIRNPNYDPENKLNTKGMCNIDDSEIGDIFTYEDYDFQIMSDEVRERLKGDKKLLSYYDDIMQNISAKSIPQYIKIKIFDIMKDVIGDFDTKKFDKSNNKVYKVAASVKKFKFDENSDSIIKNIENYD